MDRRLVQDMMPEEIEEDFITGLDMSLILWPQVENLQNWIKHGNKTGP